MSLLTTVSDASEHVPESRDRKSTRLNSSHPSISYAVFCLKKKMRKLLRAEAKGRIERLIDRLHPPDIAEMLPELGPAETRTVVDILFSVQRAARTLRELPADVLPGILELLDDKQIADMLERLQPDDAVSFLEVLPEERRLRVTSALPAG